MSFTQITVTHGFSNIDDTAASGVVIFKLSGQMTNGSVTYHSALSVHAALDPSGNLSQVLPANNDPATFPQGTTYTATILLNGAADDGSGEYSITVPYDAVGGTVDLGSLLPSQVGA